MDEMPSAEFRKTYARLRKPTIVTVNGHPIGQWMPSTDDWAAMQRNLDADIEARSPVGRTFNTRPFTPVPKEKRG